MLDVAVQMKQCGMDPTQPHKHNEKFHKIKGNVMYISTNKWVRSLRSLHPLGSLRSLRLLRVWLTLASLAHSHGCDEVGRERD